MADAKTHLFQFTEQWGGASGLTFGVQRVLMDQESDYQRVQVFETDHFGRLMLLDGLVMLTERDEFVYHEMLSHPAMCLLPDPRRVLVIGGGDGGTVRELLRHESLERVDLVEIDGLVVEASKAYFPHVASAFDHPRLNLCIEDGIAFVKNAEAGTYDLVLVDSTDPVGFAEGLFGEDFYRDCVRILTPEGVLASQTESPFDPAFRDDIRRAQSFLGGLFGHVATYLASIPTYPMGLWSFTMASKTLHPVRDFDAARAAERLAPFADELRYYHADLHRAVFTLPAFVQKMLAG